MFQDLIQQHIILGRPNNSGWQALKCAHCNDYKERAAFKFENETIVYNCFNCATKFVIQEGSKNLSSTAIKVLMEFGISEDSIKKETAKNFFNGATVTKTEFQKPVQALPVTEVELPKNSIEVLKGDSDWCEVAREYIKSRGLSHNVFRFFVSESEAYLGRLIIPFMFRGKIIYWQARAMDDSIQPRYKNPTVDKKNVFFNMDEVYRYTDEPLFVTEGAIDSLSIGKTAVAILGSSLSDFQETALIKAAERRKVIFVIDTRDKLKNGYKLGQKVLKHENKNFFVACFPKTVNDANSALKTYGSLWVSKHLITSAVNGFAGKLLLEVSCS